MCHLGKSFYFGGNFKKKEGLLAPREVGQLGGDFQSKVI